jgi:hypothetical protein
MYRITTIWYWYPVAENPVSFILTEDILALSRRLGTYYILSLLVFHNKRLDESIRNDCFYLIYCLLIIIDYLSIINLFQPHRYPVNSLYIPKNDDEF